MSGLDWAYDRAKAIIDAQTKSGWCEKHVPTGAMNAFARYISEHEEAPAVLLACPFCGGEASDTGHIQYSRPLDTTTWLDGQPVTEAFYVNCMSCGAVSRSGVVGGYQTKAEAITAWNTRAALNGGAA